VTSLALNLFLVS